MIKQLGTAFSLLLFSTFCCSGLKAQIAYSPVIDSLIYLSTPSSVSLTVRQLSGDTTVMLDGTPQTITTRNYQFNEIQNKATRFIREQFESYGLETRYQDYSSTGRNVLGWKTGSKYPDKKFIICAHYDDMPSNAVAPGADDNASGVVAVMEAARILSPYPSEYTLVFAAWDEEEIGLVGSRAYADSASYLGEQILGVLNFDMIAWDSNDDYKMTIGTNSLSSELTSQYEDVMNMYTPEINWNYTAIEASDHASFWYNGYPAILGIEEYPGDFNAYYHTQQDKFSNLNIAYFNRMVQAAVAGLATLGWDCKLSFDYDPVASGSDTAAKLTTIAINTPRTIADGDNSPRLYFKTGNSDFQYLMPASQNGNQFTFELPGQQPGTVVSYYFAMQDSAGIMMGTYPDGGRGMNPPGTQAPSTLFSYFVAPVKTEEFCSVSTPKAIPDRGYVLDTIPVTIYGGVQDIDVTVNISHTMDKTLNIFLLGPNGNQVELSSGNGGSNANYTGTIFDDEASVSIKMGTAPFTGRFKPEQPLSNFDNLLCSGNWILKVQDSVISHTGTLDSWCMTLGYYDLAVEVPLPVQSVDLSLGQNFPNPVANSTTIPFTLTKDATINLELFDLYGRKLSTIAAGSYLKGTHFVNLDMEPFAPGTYFYRLQNGSVSKTKALLLTR
jgi:subtilisin-like proprotein convertase family protein